MIFLALASLGASLIGGLKPNKPPVLPGEINTLVYERITSDDRMVKVWRPHYQASKEVINMEKNTVNHSAHSTWRCQYHIVFAPKFRRKVIYGQLRADIGKILRKLCEEKKVEIIEAEACVDHIHMLVSIPPHISVAQFMGYLKGKSTLMIFDRHANLKYKYGSRHFWCRGYYVDTVGKNKKAIEEYIRNQLVEDEMMDQMTMKEYMDPFTGSKNK
jgi:putative transposase